MRRVIAPALLAVFLFAGSSASAGFGLFNHGAGQGCDSGCAVEPTCGFEAVEPCCDPCGDSASCRGGLLHKLFHHNNSCDAGCGASPCSIEPTCGLEFAPVDCGCTVAEPACGCEVAQPCRGSNGKLGGLFHKLFHKNRDCGCDVAAVSSYEPSCGCGF